MTGNLFRWRWYQRLRRGRAVWGVAAAAVGLAGIAVGLSISFVTNRGTSSAPPFSSIRGAVLEVDPSPSAVLVRLPATVEPTGIPSPPPELATPTTVPVPSAPPPPAQPTGVASGDLGSVQRLLALVNDERRKVGVGALALDVALAAAAQAHAEALAAAGVMSHQLPGGLSLDARVESAGYVGWSALAENLARGPAAPEEVVALLLASTTHRARLLAPKYREAGVGHFFSSETGHFWVLDLAAR